MKVFQQKVPEDAIATFCKKWQITEFALFGSILRDDFRPDSDVDVLVNFVAEAKWSLFDIVSNVGRTENIIWTGGLFGGEG